jgi:hypothetical protein
LLTAACSSIPVISGIITSQKITSKSALRIRPSACRPLSASVTSCCGRNNRRIERATNTSSSTTNTRRDRVDRAGGRELGCTWLPARCSL